MRKPLSPSSQKINTSSPAVPNSPRQTSTVKMSCEMARVNSPAVLHARVEVKTKNSPSL